MSSGRITRIASGCSAEKQQQLTELYQRLYPEFGAHFTPDFKKDAKTKKSCKLLLLLMMMMMMMMITTMIIMIVTTIIIIMIITTMIIMIITTMIIVIITTTPSPLHQMTSTTSHGA